MADKKVSALLEWKTDQASLRQTEQGAKRLFSNLSNPKTPQQLKATNKEVDKLREGLVKVERQAKDTARAVGDIDAQAKFDEVSRRVALAGDVQSNLGALSGLAGAAGAGGLGQGIGVAGELVVLTEELPRLKTALAGLPSAIGSAASALGPLGFAAIAVGGSIAIAGKQITDSLKDINNEIAARTEAIRSVEELIAEGGTSEELQQAIAEQNRIIETETSILEQNTARYQNAQSAAEDQLGELGGKLAFGVLQVISSGEQAVADAINESEAKIAQAEQLVAGLLQAQTEGRFATNDAAAAGERRNEMLRNEAEQMRQRIITEQQFMSMSSDALNQRVQQIQAEIDANEAAARGLQEAGLDAEQYTQAILTLNNQLEYIKTTATPAARAVEALAKAEERRTKAAEEAKRIQEEIKTLDTQAREQSRKVADDYAKRQVDLAKKQAQGELDAQKDLQRRLTDAQTELARDQANAVLQAQRDTFQAQLDFQRGEAAAARQHADSLEDIRLQAQRDERRNILDRNFKAIFEQRIQTRERIQDEQRGFSRERREAITAFQDQAEDRNRAFADERMDRLRQYEQARSDIQLDNQRRLSDLRANLMQERMEQQAAYVAQLTDLKAFLSAETAAKKLALQQQFSLTKGGSKTTPLSKGNSQPLPKVSNVNQQSNQQTVNVTINESGNPQKTLRLVKETLTQ